MAESEIPWWKSQDSLGELMKDCQWEYAIVIQGPYMGSRTERSVRVFLERNHPTCLVIVSTYSPTLTMLSSFERDVIEGRSPHSGRLIYLNVRPPTDDEFWKTNYWNQNLQRLSSYVGLRFAHDLGIEMSLKCRSDAFFVLDNVCELLQTQYIDPFPPIRERGVGVRGRIAVSNHTQKEESFQEVTRCGDKIHSLGRFHIADMWMFGYTSDLLKFYDVSPGSQPIRYDHAPETNLTERWMREVDIGSDITGLTELASRYLVIVNDHEIGFLWPDRMHSYEMFIKRGKTHLLAVLHDQTRSSRGMMLSHEDWLKLVETHI